MFNPKRSFSRYLNTKKLYPVAIDPAKERTKIILNYGRDKIDITDSHALISLKPFAIAINTTAIVNDTVFFIS